MKARLVVLGLALAVSVSATITAQHQYVPKDRMLSYVEPAFVTNLMPGDVFNYKHNPATPFVRAWGEYVYSPTTNQVYNVSDFVGDWRDYDVQSNVEVGVILKARWLGTPQR